MRGIALEDHKLTDKLWAAEYESSLGRLQLCSEDGKQLSEIRLPRESAAAGQMPGLDQQPLFSLTRRWLDGYFAGRQPDFQLPLALKGTAFQQQVWELLLQIPYGQAVSYGTVAGQLAAKRGRASSARAVGGAVGRNPVPIVVPCHRVLGQDGSLTGYSGGLDIKIQLLRLEGIPFR